jgi:hypothetical protein
MLRRSSLTVFALAVAFVVGTLVSTGPATVKAQNAPAGHGKCCGIATALGTGNSLYVYRAFEDGTVERLGDRAQDSAWDGKWHAVAGR